MVLHREAAAPEGAGEVMAERQGICPFIPIFRACQKREDGKRRSMQFGR